MKWEMCCGRGGGCWLHENEKRERRRTAGEQQVLGRTR